MDRLPPTLGLRFPARPPRLTIVEHHPWAPYSGAEDHHLQPRDACALHGTTCAANRVIEAAIHLGYDPFA